jgi:hypothetical protein
MLIFDAVGLQIRLSKAIFDILRQDGYRDPPPAPPC